MSDDATRARPCPVVQLDHAKARLRTAPPALRQTNARTGLAGRPTSPDVFINGVNVAEMGLLLDAALAAPDDARANWRVVTTWEAGPQGAWGHTHSRYDFDDVGQDPNGPAPLELLLGATNACVILGLRVRAAREALRLERIEVTTMADSALRGLVGLPTDSPGFLALDLEVAIRGKGFPERLQELTREVLAASPILACFRQPVEVSSRMVV